MTEESKKIDPVRDRLAQHFGKPMGGDGPTLSPDPVNLPMVRHWVDAFDDQNPVYLDEVAAAQSRFGQQVAPPAMMQAWTMPRPIIEGIAERGGSPVEVSNNPLSILDDAGFTATLATNSELEFERYLSPGDHLTSAITLETVSDQKKTSVGLGYFVTWLTTYTCGDADNDKSEVVGRQRFRVFKFKPGS